MPTRTITLDGRSWRVMPSGWLTSSERDEVSLLFVAGTGDEREVRVTRFSPRGVRSREAALAEMSDVELARLFHHSQPSDTSPEAGYRP